MFTDIPLALIAGILLPVNAPIEEAAAPQVFVELIVKACPSADQSAQANKPSAVQGYYADPINQGKGYEHEHALSKEERQAAFTAMGCIDVPVPPEWISVELTRQACMSSHRIPDRASILAASGRLPQRFPRYRSVGMHRARQSRARRRRNVIFAFARSQRSRWVSPPPPPTSDFDQGPAPTRAGPFSSTSSRAPILGSNRR